MKYITTGIDIGTHFARLCIIEHDSKTKKSEVIGCTKVALEGMHHGYIQNKESIEKCLLKLIKETNKTLLSSIDSAIVSFGSTSLSTVAVNTNTVITKADNEVTLFDLENIEKSAEENAHTNNYKIIHSNTIEYKLDGQTVFGSPEGMKGNKLEARKLFIRGLVNQIDDIENILLNIGVEPIAILPKDISASAFALSEKHKFVGSAYVDIGAETTTCVIYEKNTIIGYVIFPIGSNDITNDIALGLKISLEEAEQVKNGTNTKVYPRKKIEDIISARIDDVSELINNYLKKLKRQALLPGGIILSGGGSNLHEIEEQFKKTLKLPVKKVDFEITTQKKGIIRSDEFLESYTLAKMSETFDKNASYSGSKKFFQKIKENFSGFFKQFLP